MALIELTVENLAVVESVRLALDQRFTVLTGETGAGKSLVVDAMALALGARATADLIRRGADAATVEAVFEGVEREPDAPLDDLVAEGEGTVIVSRELAADGRSVVRVNRRAVTVGSLAMLGSRLAEIHGQHQQQRLLAPERQLALLDRFAAHRELLSEVRRAFEARRATLARAAEMVTDPAELDRRRELLRYQADEIGRAALREGELQELEERLRSAQHAEAILSAAQRAQQLLSGEGSGLDALRGASVALGASAAHDARFAPLGERATELAIEAEELAREIERQLDRVELDPGQRAAAEERLALIYDLLRKYGGTPAAVIACGAEATDELRLLEAQATERDRLRRDADAHHHALVDAASRLSTARAEAASLLRAQVNAELPPLGLPDNAFDIEVQPVELGATGGDRVVFTFAPNPGEPPRPLARIASGGESSRVSLALKVVLAAADETPLLIFDEVDAGVGGRHGVALGERLRRLAAYHQVLCVTHLAQVAAYADAHLHVEKRVEAGRTFTAVRRLEGGERAAELASMLAGLRAGTEAQAVARALLREAATSAAVRGAG
ncbi:MAG: DNA repair protein RecN [Candidatus Limnocylindria bacterium]